MTEPDLVVVSGILTEEELAVLVGVVYSARAAGPEAPPAPVPTAWRASYRPTVPLRVGPAAWRASGRPR
jgi:hypothetical protein